ncbi:MAG TPA: hypothetical protein VLE49_17155 [Anaerolineales bacterium]|nr:hypothetical protein [Anaerolineales bacterium]
MFVINLSGKINTSFVERANPTIRQCVAKLTRRTWGQPIMRANWLSICTGGWHTITLLVTTRACGSNSPAAPTQRETASIQYRRSTPAMAAGLTRRRWSVMELLGYPLL